MKQENTDVIVVAAGLGGLAAAVSAAENGARVIAFEKGNTTGGAANMGMGPLGIESRFQKKHMISITPGEAYRKHMNFVHWRADPRLVREYYFKSGDTINWLEDMGVEWLTVTHVYPTPEAMRGYATSEQTWHVVRPADGSTELGPRLAGGMIKALTQRAEDLGVDIRLNTPVKSLIKDGAAVVGVVAEGPDGEQIECRGKAVIVASGGAGDNPQMIKDYTGYEWGKDFFSFRVPGMDGDGLNMMWAVGATKTEMVQEMIYILPHNMATPENFIIDGAFRQPCLWVNARGRALHERGCRLQHHLWRQYHLPAAGPLRLLHLRCRPAQEVQEERSRHHLARASARTCSITSTRRSTPPSPPVMSTCSRPTASRSWPSSWASTPDVFQETVDDYNDLCDGGWDDLFEKDHRYMQPIAKPPFYACRFFPAAYGTLGGVQIDYKAEVLDDELNPIPGLYAAGLDACTIYGDSYPFILPGNTMGFTLNSGRIAGENAAAL